MNTLEEAWQWYENTRVNLRLFQRLTDKYWDKLPWDGTLSLDDRFRILQSEIVFDQIDNSLSYLDDLAVVVLFSVFESQVRRKLLEEMTPEAQQIRHPTLYQAGAEAGERVERGSFARVLESFKGIAPGLVEEVNQVRRYRNWVVHGKRSKKPPSVDPKIAHDRLVGFLQILAEPTRQQGFGFFGEGI